MVCRTRLPDGNPRKLVWYIAHPVESWTARSTLALNMLCNVKIIEEQDAE